jgi:quinolinate synthase
MITEEDMKNIRKNHPDRSIVAYVNTNAEVKAHADICCTSANAVEIVNKIQNDKIYFVPDKNLGSWVKKNTDKDIKIWNGFCNVHNQIRLVDLEEGVKNHPDAITLVHPEAPMKVLNKADKVLSTGQMVNFVKESDGKEFLIGTEKGLIYRLKTLYPNKNFYKMGRYFVCRNMKKNTLQKIYKSLKNEKTEITLSEEIINKSFEAINRMFTI